MRNKKFVIALIAVAAFIIFISTGCSKKEAPVESRTALSQVEDNSIDVFGIVKAKNTYSVSIDISARVVDMKVVEGQQIKRDEVLASLDISEYNEKIKTIERELNIVKLEIQKAINGIIGESNEIKRLMDELQLKKESLDRKSDADIRKLLNDLNIAKDRLENSKKEKAEKSRLFDEGSLTKDELAIYEEKHMAAEKTVHDLVLSLEGLVKSRETEIEQLKSRIDQRLAQLDNKQIKDAKSARDLISIKIMREKEAGIESQLKGLKDKLNKSCTQRGEVISTIDKGVVYDIGYIDGDMINPSRKLFTIAGLDSLIVEANVPEEFIKDIKMGAEVKISPNADKSKTYSGRVTSISSKALTVHGETVIPVEISIADKDGFLMPNFNVDVKIAK